MEQKVQRKRSGGAQCGTQGLDSEVGQLGVEDLTVVTERNDAIQARPIPLETALPEGAVRSLWLLPGGQGELVISRAEGV